MKLIKTILILMVFTGAAAAGTYLPSEGNFDVSVWQTTGKKPFREILTSPFTVHAYTNRVPIDVDAAEVRGRFSWLGVSMTDAWVQKGPYLLYFGAEDVVECAAS